MKTFVSDISHKNFPISEKVSGLSLRAPIIDFIKKEHPNFTDDGFLAYSEVNVFREKYITEYMQQQLGELSESENVVLNSITGKTTLSDKIDEEDIEKISFGQKIADKVASFGGSWIFIISFAVFILIWILLNVFVLVNKGFDPYPFILLNLLLSCLAALQAPVIMMSQNRQEEKDRTRGEKDYMINLKSELEIRTLHEKIDHLIMHQQAELLEMQKTQIEMMSNIMEKIRNK